MIRFILGKRFSLFGFGLAMVLTGAVSTFFAMQVDMHGIASVQETVAIEHALPEVRAAEEAQPPFVDVFEREYSFSTDWHCRHVPIWESVLAPYKNQPGINYLEVGVFEGQSSIWMLENVLTHPTATLTAVDVFTGSWEETFKANLERAGAEEKVTIVKGMSQVQLRTLELDSFDIIYIDGGHMPAAALEDAVLCWRLLKNEGLLIIDDMYLTGPKMATEVFWQFFGYRFEAVHNSRQCILKKNSKKLPSGW